MPGGLAGWRADAVVARLVEAFDAMRRDLGLGFVACNTPTISAGQRRDAPSDPCTRLAGVIGTPVPGALALSLALAFV